LSEKSRVRAKNMQYLYDLIFVKFLNKKIFEKKYFDSFKYEDLNKGDILFRENEKLDYVYLIVEGNLDLYIRKNIFTLMMI
jgi:CRP-like cAMP-binding protein